MFETVSRFRQLLLPRYRKLHLHLIRLKTFIASVLPWSPAVRIMTELNLAPEPAAQISTAYRYGGSAGRPVGYNSWHRLAFYNIGWDYKSKKKPYKAKPSQRDL